MSFVIIESVDFSKDYSITQRVEVIQWKKDEKCSEVYINLRSFLNGKPVDNGICLTKDEFNKLLPYIDRRENVMFGEERVIQFYRSPGSSMYEFDLTKPKLKSQGMILTEVELVRLLANKERILVHCSCNEVDSNNIR